MINRDAIALALARAEPQELFALAGEIQGLATLAYIRLKDAPPSVPELLDPDQAAQLCSVHKKWLLKKTRGQSFRRDLGHRTKRFEKEGLLRWRETALP